MTTNLKTIAALTLGLALAGCVDTEDASQSQGDSVTRGQAVTVVPEFHLSGVEQMPEKLFVTELGLVVSEIRLVPYSAQNGIAYSNATPAAMRFKLIDGEFVQRGEEMVLPQSGRYIVSIRLEPVAALPGEKEVASFSMSGYVAEIPDFSNPAKQSDGTPLPLPFDEKPDEVDPDERVEVSWTPFQYNSKKTIFYTLNDVELTPGNQVLTFNFDVSNWAISLTDPISKAVRNAATEEQEGIDVTRQLEGVGQGADVLIAGGEVRAEIF